MFGKGKAPTSVTGKFIMAAGRAVGNIHPPKNSANRKGNGTAPKSAPVKAAAGRQVKSLPPGRKPSLGKTSPAKMV